MEGPVKKRGGFPFRKKVAEPEPESVEVREAREAAERLAEEQAARIAARLAEIGAAWAQVGERIRAALPSGGDYRQAYFLSLLRQGREAEELGRATVAAHCRRCIESGLAALPTTAPAVQGVTTSSGKFAESQSAAAPSALSLLKGRWDTAARQRAATLLARHAKRLAPAEREAYAASLEALSTASGGAQPLRRKLIDRLLRAQAYRRRGARLSGWKSTPVPENGPAGPYNDFIALEQTVQRIAGIHPEWAAEFLDLYGDLNKIRGAYQTLLPTAKRS
jgi:hypothetical protein